MFNKKIYIIRLGTQCLAYFHSGLLSFLISKLYYSYYKKHNPQVVLEIYFLINIIDNYLIYEDSKYEDF